MIRYATLVLLLSCTSCGASDGKLRSAHKNSQFTAGWIHSGSLVELGVISPAGELYFVQQPDLECVGFWRNGRVITVDVGNSYGVRWIDGAPHVGRLFTKPGTYRLVVTENLEADRASNHWQEFKLVVTDHLKSDGVSKNEMAGKCVNPRTAG